jgi:hemerythrin-like domain-containing protein
VFLQSSEWRSPRTEREQTKNKIGSKYGKGKKSQSKLDLKFDIIKLIVEDHKPLKKLVRVLKDSDQNDLAKRKSAFEEFAPLLIAHAKPEEVVLYRFMNQEKQLRTQGFEGETEHEIADRLIREAKKTKNNDLWSARTKVLAELVEHHIKEEEEDMLPDFRKFSTSDQRNDLGCKYLEKKSAYRAGRGLGLVPPTRQADYADSRGNALERL